jgi:hypothetical protein
MVIRSVESLWRIFFSMNLCEFRARPITVQALGAGLSAGGSKIPFES